MSEEQDSTRALRDTMGSFATGVTVVTTLDGAGRPGGFTANSYTSVSLDPPLVLVCLGRSAESYPTFAAASAYAVNILALDQAVLAERFAARAGEKFDGVPWSSEATGSPILEGVVAWLDCEMERIVDGGDHGILIGRVVRFASDGREPLGYCRGVYGRFRPGVGREP